jgi:hypothetical protein
MRNDFDGSDDAAVRERLRMLAAAEREIAAPVHVEWQVMRAWDQAHPPATAKTGTRLRRIALPAAAAIGLACAVTLVRFAQLVPRVDLLPPSLPSRPAHALSERREPARVEGPARSERREPARVEGPALSKRRGPARVEGPAAATPQTVDVLLVGTPVSPGEQMRVVRVRIARTTLTAMGLRTVGTADTETVDVDMLVGEDGVARGLRLEM